jgi:predicted oxidoreductase
MSDALEPEETFDNLYAYPNPVYPNYEGYITIKGIMDDTEVRILDAGGNLVAVLEGTGGIAVWDGKNVNGDRVASGVYTAMCNTKSGKGHGVVKILMLN